MASPERTEDGRYIVVNGRRWKAQDPELPQELVTRLLSELGKARSAIRSGRSAGRDVRWARQRVQWAKEGLGERGLPWWEMNLSERCDRAKERLEKLDEDSSPESEQA